MKGYKVFNSDMKCRDFQFKENATFTQEGDPVLCGKGFHFCTKLEDCFSYYSLDSTNKVCEVEAIGDITEAKEGCSKRSTNNIKILGFLDWSKVLEMCNIGKDNTGFKNSGNRNSGHHNSGSLNSGDRNSGDYNSGNCNSGDYNSGSLNSGKYNSGYHNSGDYNSGYRNSGDYNSGNYNSGFFNTDTPTCRLFNKETKKLREGIQIPWVSLPIVSFRSWEDMSDKEKKDNPKAYTPGGILVTLSYKEAWEKAWSGLDDITKKQFVVLPNFDSKIFEEITGVKLTKKEIKRLKEI